MNETRSIVIIGTVQGVCFRIFTLQAARRLNLNGWVRNARNGTVEVLVHGDQNQIREFEKQLRIGPSMSRVRQIVSKESAEEISEGFFITY